MPALDKTIDRQAHYRSEKKKVGKYKHAYTDFVESVTLEEFRKIEEWKSLFGSGGSPTKVNREIARQDIQNQPEHLRWWLELRFTDRFLFRKIYQMIQYRYSTLQDHFVERSWNNDTKYQKLATGVVRSAERCGVCPEWQDNRSAVVEYLKQLYDHQEGLCAIAKIPMTFERKCENAISVDRIDSTMGYQPDNIHLTCWWVNRMKFDLELSDFKNKVKVLAESFVA